MDSNLGGLGFPIHQLNYVEKRTVAQMMPRPRKKAHGPLVSPEPT